MLGGLLGQHFAPLFGSKVQQCGDNMGNFVRVHVTHVLVHHIAQIGPGFRRGGRGLGGGERIKESWEGYTLPSHSVSVVALALAPPLPLLALVQLLPSPASAAVTQ